MGRRLRLADGAGSKSLPKSGPACPSPSTRPRPQSQACRRSVGCSTGGNAEKKRLSPTIIAFQNSGHCRRAGHTNPVGEAFAPRPNRRPRRAGVAALGAPIAPGAAQNANAMPAAFRRPGLSSPSRCAPSEAEAFWRCLVSRPCLPSDPYSVAGRANRASNCGLSSLEARGGACCFHPTIGTTA